jgi:hypothetical protein
MMVGTENGVGPERERVLELAASQIDNYLRQPEELVSHFNREVSALDGYRGRQLLELLQNADDAGVDAEAGCRLLLDLSRERLVVANTGKPFSKKGLTSLVISDCSPKQLDRNRFIGCKGLGFRAILTWTDRPLISSGPYEVLFDRVKAVEKVQRIAAEHSVANDIVLPFKESTGRWPAAVMRFPDLPPNDDHWLDLARACRHRGYDTVIVLPLPDGQRGDDIHKEMIEQIKDLPTSSLLFCRHLTCVEISGDFQRTWNLLRQNHTDGRATVVLEQDGAPELWHVYRHTGQVSAEAAETSSGGRRDFEVAVAVPEVAKPNPTGALCVFFPTHERLPCAIVMHATLETSDDRNRLVVHTSNREVLGQLAMHVAAVVESHAAPAMPRRALELIAGVENADPELKALGFVDALVKACAGRSIFPCLDGTVKPSTDVRQVPHATWLSQLGPDLFPEILAVGPSDALSGLLALFRLSWFDTTTLKDRLKRYLLGIERSRAGEILGRLLADGQLREVGAGGLLVGADGQLVTDGNCFFTPSENLSALPSWASNIRFVDEAFQAGLLRGSKAPGLRVLASDLTRCQGEVDEYRFDTVARALIDQVEQGLDDDAPAISQRWRELLRWLFDASSSSRQVLPQLPIMVITTRGTLRRATGCYLGPDYSEGQIAWRLYQRFEQDEFVGPARDNGLAGLAGEDVESFLLAIGVAAAPRLESFDQGPDYKRFREVVVDRLSYPRTVRAHRCESPDEVRAHCRSYQISGIQVPDRWVRLLKEGDPVGVTAYLLSSGSFLLAGEIDPRARFAARVGRERDFWPDPSVPIPNATLFLLRETSWVLSSDGKLRRPSEIMLSSQGVRVLRGVYVRHSIDARDALIAAHGGREALDSLLTRLGAVSSLETLTGQSLYELLQALPERDPSGEVAPRIYRTLIESAVSVDDSSHRGTFLSSGRMWGRHKGAASYLSVSQLRYNANLAVSRVIEEHIPLVDIPQRMNTTFVKELFGIAALTSEEIQLSLLDAGTEYDPGSEDANQHLRIAIPYIYALRLARNLDDRGRELNLLRKAVLRVCIRAQVVAKLPGGNSEEIFLKAAGERIVIDTSLIVVGEYRENASGFLTFWLSVAELVAELLGRDVADEVGGVLRCRSTAEMLEVVRVRLGADADAKLGEARSRFEDPFKEGDDEKEQPIPPPGPAPSPPSPPPSPPAPQPKSTGDGGGSGTVSAPITMTFEPVPGPADRPAKKRRLVVAGPGGGGGGGHGPLATESVTFKVVEAFERCQDRFTIPVSHLRGSDAFGCDLLSVASEAIRDKAMTEHSISEADILRYIEVKGRSSRTGEVELTNNEYRAAERLGRRYWLYRVFVAPSRESHYEVAVLSDPLNSKAVRTVTRFDLAEGSGASWYSMAEKIEEETAADGQRQAGNEQPPPSSGQ